MTVANKIRGYVDQHYLLGSVAGRELLEIADEVDALEAAASPVTPDTECGGRPCVAEDGQ